jgi:RTX calcium-binding nonapeptide repeat (4 copies)/Calx-beta domain
MTWETIISNHLSVPAGKGDAIIRITSIDNLIHEANKSLIVTASTIASSAAATGTIIDNDPLSYITGVTSSTAVEGAANVFTVSISPQTAIPTTVDLSIASVTAIAGSDYSTSFEISLDSGINWVSLSANSALIPIGVASLQVRHSTINDLIHELTETYELTASCNGSSVSAIGTITDNDAIPVPLAMAGVSVNEGGIAIFNLALQGSNSVDTPISFTISDGTATASDYTNVQTSLNGVSNWLPLVANLATLPPGYSSIYARVQTVDDTVVESTEQFTLTASCGGESITATATIIDNDIAIVPPNVINGTSDDETLIGTTGADIIYGNGGNDNLIGGGSNDTLVGGSGGNDTITSNTLDGTNDTLKGVGEIDVLVGGAGSFNTFVLGDSSGCYYLGTGNDDCANLVNFNADYDTIQLFGAAENYNLVNPLSGIGIASLYHVNAGGNQDLIAKITTSSLLDLAINFTYI